jgi:hypothetical protein
MAEFDAYGFVGFMNILRSITLTAGQAGDSPKLEPNQYLSESIEDFARQLAEMKMQASSRAVSELAKTVASYGTSNQLANANVGFVCRVLRYEMEGRKFVQIDREDLYSKGAALFGPEVASNFPTSGAFEIDEAGKCLALERSTAAVFHLMRVMEVAIRAASACLGIPDPVRGADRNWGTMLRKFKTEMDRRNVAKPPKWQAASDKDFFDEIHVSLDAVRNVWRNATMHVENKYTLEEAEHIFGAVRGFMKKIASRMDEQGQPSA